VSDGGEKQLSAIPGLDYEISLILASAVTVEDMIVGLIIVL